MAHEFNVLALIKGAERYVFVYDDVSRDNLVDAFRDLAGNPDASLTWFDALVLTKKAREQAADFGFTLELDHEEPRSRLQET